MEVWLESRSSSVRIYGGACVMPEWQVDEFSRDAVYASLQALRVPEMFLMELQIYTSYYHLGREKDFLYKLLESNDSWWFYCRRSRNNINQYQCEIS
jgi:hypothetical protein